MSKTLSTIPRCLKSSLILGFSVLIHAGAVVHAQDFPPVDCVINPNRTVDLSSAVPGVIEKLYVERSDLVKKDQVVAELDARVEKASVTLATARAEIESELQVGQINLDYDRRRKQRMDSLFGKQVVSTENKDEADREVKLSAWRLKQAKELSTIRKLELLKAREELQQKIVRSPITGFVVDTFKASGEYVEDQAILRVAQLDPLRIEAIVPMSLFGKIKVGMSAEVFPEILAGESRNAKVTVVDRMGDAASGTFGVRLELPNAEYELPAGMKCDLKFLDQPSISSLEDRPNNDRKPSALSSNTSGTGSAPVTKASTESAARQGEPSDLGTFAVTQKGEQQEI